MPRLRSLLATILVAGGALGACGTPFGGAAQCNHLRGCPSSPPTGNPEDPGRYVAGAKTIPAGTGHLFPVHAWYPVAPESVDAAGSTHPRYDGLPGVGYVTTLGYRNPVPAPGRFPLVLYSADSAGNATEISWLAETLASHGYVVVAPEFIGDRLVDHVQNRSLPVTARPAVRRQQLNDTLAGVLGGAGGLAGSIDTSRVGIVGTGTGGTDALRAVASSPGGSVTVGTRLHFRTAVALAPQTITMTTAALASVTVPVLLEAADKDGLYPPDVDLARAFTTIRGRPLVKVVIGRSRHSVFSDLCEWTTRANSSPGRQTPTVRENLQSVDQVRQSSCTGGTLISSYAHRIAAHYIVAFLDQQLAGSAPTGQFLVPIPHAQVTVAGPVDAP